MTFCLISVRTFLHRNQPSTIDSIEKGNVQNALQLLVTAAADRTTDIDSHSPIGEIESDEETESTHPIYEKFLMDGGPNATLTMTNI